MAKKGKKSKKGKKGKGEKGPEIRTTLSILQGREQMLCPRMGDSYTRTMKVVNIGVCVRLSLLSQTFCNG